MTGLPNKNQEKSTGYSEGIGNCEYKPFTQSIEDKAEESALIKSSKKMDLQRVKKRKESKLDKTFKEESGANKIENNDHCVKNSDARANEEEEHIKYANKKRKHSNEKKHKQKDDYKKKEKHRHKDDDLSDKEKHEQRNDDKKKHKQKNNKLDKKKQACKQNNTKHDSKKEDDGYSVKQNKSTENLEEKAVIENCDKTKCKSNKFGKQSYGHKLNSETEHKENKHNKNSGRKMVTKLETNANRSAKSKLNCSEDGADRKKAHKHDFGPVFDRSIMSIRIKNKGYTRDLLAKHFPNSTKITVQDPYFVMQYTTEDQAIEDMKGTRTRRESTHDSKYMDNMFVVYNLSYKETESSIKEAFEKYGPIEKINMTYNSNKVFLGKAVITYAKAARLIGEVMVSNRVVRIERIKKPENNDTRLCLRMIKRQLGVNDLRWILVENGYKSRDIRICMNDTKRNKGYGFIDFNSAEEAARFIRESRKLEDSIGEGFTVEYSKEKPFEKRNKHNTFVIAKKSDKIK